MQTGTASAVGDWLHQVVSSNADPRLRDSAERMLEVLDEAAQVPSGPFLTVIMRTHARKLEALRDALLTLLGQSDQDFELIIVGHDLEEKEGESVRAIVEEQPASFRQRITYLAVHGGGRARPLNEAIDSASGQYFAVFDDDDLVLGHWVETFHTASQEQPERLVRAIASTQSVQGETWRGGVDGFRTSSWPDTPYPQVFEYEHHLVRNHSPFMSVAFPRELFTFWGARFDEELDVCEDWDLIIRGAYLLGVNSVEELTAIYRLWTGVTSSYSEHDRTSWETSEKRVRDKLNSRVNILPQGAPASIIESLGHRGALRIGAGAQLDEILSSTSWRMTAPMRWGMVRARAVARRVRRRDRSDGSAQPED